MRGGKRSTSWEKGQSGNPNGRPKMSEAEHKARDMLSAASPLAVKTLVEAMQLGGRDAIMAAIAVLRKTLPDAQHALEVNLNDARSGLDEVATDDIIAALRAGETKGSTT